MIEGLKVYFVSAAYLPAFPIPIYPFCPPFLIPAAYVVIRNNPQRLPDVGGEIYKHE